MAYRILINGKPLMSRDKVVEFYREDKARAFANRTFRRTRSQKIQVIKHEE